MSTIVTEHKFSKSIVSSHSTDSLVACSIRMINTVIQYSGIEYNNYDSVYEKYRRLSVHSAVVLILVLEWAGE
jgi:hypothetical protein